MAEKKKKESKWKQVLKRVFSRAQPDIYQAAKEYAASKDMKVGDVIGAAVSAYLPSCLYATA